MSTAAAAAAGTAVLSHDRPRGDSAPPAVRAGWALFETRVALGHLANTAAGAVSKTTNGRDVRVSLRRLATPPACSCLQLYTDDKVSEEPTVVSADGDLLLIHMVVAVEGVFTHKFPHNFFVYKADPESPSMRSLPPPPSDWKAGPGDTGIARRCNEFVVANLKTRYDDAITMREGAVVDDAITMREVAFVWLYRSANEQWETKKFDMPYEPAEGIVEYFFTTDTVFSFRGFICWVDFHRGIIYSDVFSPDPELSFLRFPGIEIWRGYRDFPNMYRTVSVCRDHVKFVDIDNGRYRSTGRDADYDLDFGSDDEGRSEKDDNYDGCTITSWILRMPEFEWKEDASLRLLDLSSLQSYQDSPLPRAVPKSPIVDMQEDNILHFILNGPGFLDKAWMVTIDMKSKSLGQHTLYENPIEAKDSGQYDLRNVFLEIPLLSTQLYY